MQLPVELCELQSAHKHRISPSHPHVLESNSVAPRHSCRCFLGSFTDITTTTTSAVSAKLPGWRLVVLILLEFFLQCEHSATAPRSPLVLSQPKRKHSSSPPSLSPPIRISSSKTHPSPSSTNLFLTPLPCDSDLNLRGRCCQFCVFYPQQQLQAFTWPQSSVNGCVMWAVASSPNKR